jgi:hypothetical protein
MNGYAIHGQPPVLMPPPAAPLGLRNSAPPSAPRPGSAAARAAVWWHRGGLTGYMGGADGLEWHRHSRWCMPGLWAVCVTGWISGPMHAVIDDFGSLVQVQP